MLSDKLPVLFCRAFFVKHLFLDMICLPWISKSQKSRHSRRQSYLLQAPAEGISPGLHRLQGPRLRHTVKFRTNLTNRCYRSYLLSHWVTIQFKIMCKEARHRIDCTGSILGRCAENQNGNLRWHLPWRGGSRGGLECHIPILKNDFC